MLHSMANRQAHWRLVSTSLTRAMPGERISVFDPHMQDRSKHARQRTLKPGLIGLDRWSTVLDCTIRNLSGTGAFLFIPKNSDVPDSFELLIKPDGLIQTCRVAWRNGEGIGVEFQSKAATRRERQACSPQSVRSSW